MLVRGFPHRRSVRRGRRRLFVAALALALLSATPADAGFSDGVAAYDRGDYIAAYEAWMPLASGGDPAAQRNVGHLHRFGLGVAQDFGQAAYWYREAAEAGLAGAQANLAMMYLRGQGVEAAADRAAYWFQLAAVQGHAVAQYNLGLLYLAGMGVPRDEARSLGWFHLAAKSGHAQALEALSRLVQTSAFQVGPPPPPGYPGGDNAGVLPATGDRKTADGGVEGGLAQPAPASKVELATPPPARSPATAREPASPAPISPVSASLSTPAVAGTPPSLVVPASPPERAAREPTAMPSPRPAAIQTPGAPDPEEQQRLMQQAMTALMRGDHAATEARLRPLAHAGNVEAEFQLGMLLAEPGYAKADLAEAYVWLTLAAEHGHRLAEAARHRLASELGEEERARSHELLLRRRGRS